MRNIGGINIQDSWGYNGHSKSTDHPVFVDLNWMNRRHLEVVNSPQDSEDEGKTNMEPQHGGLEDDFPFSIIFKGVMFRLYVYFLWV